MGQRCDSFMKAEVAGQLGRTKLVYRSCCGVLRFFSKSDFPSVIEPGKISLEHSSYRLNQIGQKHFSWEQVYEYTVHREVEQAKWVLRRNPKITYSQNTGGSESISSPLNVILLIHRDHPALDMIHCKHWQSVDVSGTRTISSFSCWDEMTQWLERKVIDWKARGSKPTPAPRLFLSRLEQIGSTSALTLPSNGVASRHRKGVTDERLLLFSPHVILLNTWRCRRPKMPVVGQN
ncbi:hypothetical protein CSKR_108612 [Clonorchis sinensis]|uniref:Uncharacterized protein n=1 Tax=Clonorchis sinensis TaxID=79923 RepID=A0A3R7CIX8_CLOSI|nr:hypothetical protein CSKR_108612 [Clonorchis sinensis]